MKGTITALLLLTMASLLSCDDKNSNSTTDKSALDTSRAVYQVPNSALVYTTADSANFRLTLTDTISFTEKGQPFEREVAVFVDPTKTFQTFFGIGAALTDASAETFYKLPKNIQQEFLKAHFDKDSGIGYTVVRTNINSCDFSSEMYTYVSDGDSALTSFNIDHDRKYKMPFIKESMAAAGGKLNLFASPWSPPAWMKDNNDMLHGGKLKPKYYNSWANYFTRFIKEYEKSGIPVWGVSIQNEPMAKQIWESCMYTAQEETKDRKSVV